MQIPLDKSPKNVINTFVRLLGIPMDMSSDPALLSNILRHDMLLDDFVLLEQTFGNDLSESVSLSPMLEKIRNNLIEQQPEIVEFLSHALNEGLIHELKEPETTIHRLIHVVFILDRLTRSMFEDRNFAKALYEHCMEKRQHLGIRSGRLPSFKDIYRCTGEFFLATKIVSIDIVFNTWERSRLCERVPHIKKQGFIPFNWGLVGNILEAVVTEKINGFKDNALAGVALAVNPNQGASVVGEKRHLEHNLIDGWTSLYSSWNLAFITGNLDNLDLYYPKLLVPQVLCAGSKQYLYNRVLALWLSLNFDLFRRARSLPNRVLPNRKPLAQLWGRINLKHAKKMVRQHNPKELKNFSILLTLPLQRLMKSFFL